MALVHRPVLHARVPRRLVDAVRGVVAHRACDADRHVVLDAGVVEEGLEDGVRRAGLGLGEVGEEELRDVDADEDDDGRDQFSRGEKMWFLVAQLPAVTAVAAAPDARATTAQFLREGIASRERLD